MESIILDRVSPQSSNSSLNSCISHVISSCVAFLENMDELNIIPQAKFFYLLNNGLAEPVIVLVAIDRNNSSKTIIFKNNISVVKSITETKCSPNGKELTIKYWSISNVFKEIENKLP